MFGTDKHPGLLQLQLAGAVEERPVLTSGFDSESEGRRFDPAPATASGDPTHHALDDRHAEYVSGEAGTPRAGWVHRWARRWSMRRTMRATASIVDGVMGGMAGHVLPQNAPDFLIPHPSYTDHEVDDCATAVTSGRR